MKNKIIALLIALTMLGQISVTASAISTSGETGESSAILNQEQTSFKVTVPTSLPIAVDSDGVVTTATDVEIHNNSYGPIVISDIQVDVANGWSLVDFDKDMSKSKLGLKEFGLSIQGDKVQPDGSVALTPSSWESVSGGAIKSFNYDAIVSPQKTALSDVNIANVVFVLGWAEEVEPEETSKYTLATDDDFIKIGDDFQYIGTDEYVEIPHVIQGENVESYKSMFAGTSVKGVKSTNPNVINMGYMFAGSTADSLDLSELNTAGVRYMSEMFWGSQATSIVFGSSFDTSSVKGMYAMFRDSQALALDLSRFDTSQVTTMESMFNGSQATTLDLSSFNTSNVTNMQDMFKDSQATNIDLSSFDTINVTTMYSMFRNSQATSLNLSSFDTSNVTDMQYMFRGSQALTIDLSSFNTVNVMTMYEMFRDSQALALDLSSFDTSKLDSMQSMFNGSQATSINVNNFDTSNVTTMKDMFKDSKVTSLDLSSFDTSNVTIISGMFSGSQATEGFARTQVDADKFNSSENLPTGLTFVVK